jgi:hypothetical protein
MNISARLLLPIKQPLRADEAIVTWVDQDGFQRRAKVEIPADRGDLSGEQANSLVYTIHPVGIVNVHLENSKR